MQKKIIQATITEFDKPSELNSEDRKLLSEAGKACANSYSPYSEFKVGAAALLSNGEIVTGSNQENASYPIGICAERVTLSAVSATHPKQKIISLAITFKSKMKWATPVSPCGICRQTLLEYEQRQKKNIRIILRGEGGKIQIIESAKDLLPLYFDKSVLGK